MPIALTRRPAARLTEFEATYIERQRLDPNRAAGQHAAYCAALGRLGFTVLALPAANTLPDSVFVEDTAVLFREVAILTRPGAVSRQAEIALIAPEILKLKPTLQITAPATLDGGDVLLIGRNVFVGLSRRTNAAGIDQLGRMLAPYGYRVTPVAVHGCLHLKTGVTALDDHRLLINPRWLDTAPFAGYELIAAAPDEPWAANVLRAGDRLLMNAASPKTVATVREKGFDVSTADIGEFMKMEAGLTCMCLLCP